MLIQAFIWQHVFFESRCYKLWAMSLKSKKASFLFLCLHGQVKHVYMRATRWSCLKLHALNYRPYLLSQKWDYFFDAWPLQVCVEHAHESNQILSKLHTLNYRACLLSQKWDNFFCLITSTLFVSMELCKIIFSIPYNYLETSCKMLE